MNDLENVTGRDPRDHVDGTPRFVDFLKPEDRDALKNGLTVRHHARGEMILAQCDDGADVFVILDGIARATIFSNEGKLVAFRDIRDGDIFGELAAIDGSSRSASVVAVQAVGVGVMTPAQFRHMVDTRESFRWALLTYLSQQTRNMTQRIFEYSTMLTRDRLIQELLRLACAGEAKDGAFVIEPAPTHFDLAARISTHREAVSREMSYLAKKGLLSKEAGRLFLHDVRALQDASSMVR
jgi:CRP-like cAMP-binding protein